MTELRAAFATFIRAAEAQAAASDVYLDSFGEALEAARAALSEGQAPEPVTSFDALRAANESRLREMEARGQVVRKAPTQQAPEPVAQPMKEMALLYPDLRALIDGWWNTRDPWSEWDDSVRNRLIAWGMHWLGEYAHAAPTQQAPEPVAQEPYGWATPEGAFTRNRGESDLWSTTRIQHVALYEMPTQTHCRMPTDRAGMDAARAKAIEADAARYRFIRDSDDVLVFLRPDDNPIEFTGEAFDLFIDARMVGTWPEAADIKGTAADIREGAERLRQQAADDARKIGGAVMCGATDPEFGPCILPKGHPDHLHEGRANYVAPQITAADRYRYLRDVAYYDTEVLCVVNDAEYGEGRIPKGGMRFLNGKPLDDHVDEGIRLARARGRFE